jgi:Na+-transporting methylmalonyl-CoA/oxaloacetate decarboxylase gamma subunit
MYREAYELWKEATAEMTDEEKEVFAQEILAEAEKTIKQEKKEKKKKKKKKLTTSNDLGRGAAIGAAVAPALEQRSLQQQGYKTV